MNKVFLIGNLTRDPDLSETSTGASVCHFTIAVTRSYTSGDGERQTDFFNVTVWKGLAENVAKYCTKGSKVAVSGSVQIRTYEDNQGVKRTAVDVIGQEVEFLSKTGESGGQNADMGLTKSADRHTGTPRQKPALQSFDDDGEIPF